MAGEWILIVDGDADARFIISTVLRRFGFQVLEAEEPQQAVDLLGARPFDVLVVETYPGTGELLERTRELSTAVRVLCVSTQGAIPGCHGYVQKPAAPDPIVREVNRLADPDEGTDRPSGATPSPEAPA